jgi:hypothetical protein
MRPWFVHFAGLCLAVIVAGSFNLAHAQDSQLPKSQPNSPIFLSVRRPVVNTAYVMHVINAAEHTYRHSHNRFGSWQELYESGALTEAQGTAEEWRRVAFATGPEAVPGHRLTLIVSTDGSAYSTSLREIGNAGCGLSLFSDQTGQIYEGTALDCPKWSNNSAASAAVGIARRESIRHTVNSRLAVC